MKLQIIDTNRGQIPSSITSAIDLSGYSRKQIEQYLKNNKNEMLIIRNSFGYHYGIAERRQIGRHLDPIVKVLNGPFYDDEEK